MIQVEAAWQAYADAVQPLPIQALPLQQAHGRVLAQPVSSAIDLPPFCQSAMDGYALRSDDLAAASEAAPVTLDCVQFIAAQQQSAQQTLETGQCARIFTGAMVPPGADAVVMQEKTSLSGSRVQFMAPVAAGNNIRRQGEEAQAGFELCGAPQTVDSQLIAAASFVGVDRLCVYRAPRVAVLVTGDELAPPGRPLKSGEVYECNGAFLSAWFAERGIEAQVSLVPDQPAALSAAMSQALEQADLVVITGGASVGERDYAREAARSIGVEEVFWRVAQKPGKPLAFGMAGAKPVLILPGNPAAVFVCAWVHLDPVLRRLQGRSQEAAVWSPGRLGFSVDAAPLRDRFLRVTWRLNAHGVACLETLPLQSSHMLTNLVATNALLRVPAGRAMDEGESALFLPLKTP